MEIEKNKLNGIVNQSDQLFYENSAILILIFLITKMSLTLSVLSRVPRMQPMSRHVSLSLSKLRTCKFYILISPHVCFYNSRFEVKNK